MRRRRRNGAVDGAAGMEEAGEYYMYLVHGSMLGQCLFTGLDYWTGLLDWTTGLTRNDVKCIFQPFSVYERS